MQDECATCIVFGHFRGDLHMPNFRHMEIKDIQKKCFHRLICFLMTSSFFPGQQLFIGWMFICTLGNLTQLAKIIYVLLLYAKFTNPKCLRNVCLKQKKSITYYVLINNTRKIHYLLRAYKFHCEQG